MFIKLLAIRYNEAHVIIYNNMIGIVFDNLTYIFSKMSSESSHSGCFFDLKKIKDTLY